MSDIWAWWVGGQNSHSVDEDEKDDGVNKTEDRNYPTSIEFEHEPMRLASEAGPAGFHDPMLEIESMTSVQCLFQAAPPRPMMVWAVLEWFFV